MNAINDFAAAGAGGPQRGDAGGDSPWRTLGTRAHQMRALTRAADHYLATGDGGRHTACWLISGACELSVDAASELDALAHSLREAGVDASRMQQVQRLRVRAHRLQAMLHAADHFLEQDAAEDADTGSWLVSCAVGGAKQFASEIDDCSPLVERVESRRAPPVDVVDAHEAALQRRVAAMTERLPG